MRKNYVFDSCLRTPHKRYKPICRMKSGSPTFRADDGHSSPTPGMQEGIIDAQGPGQYTYILTYLYADGHTAESQCPVHMTPKPKRSDHAPDFQQFC